MAYEVHTTSSGDVFDAPEMRALEELSIGEVLEHITDHLNSHLFNLHTGFYDQIYPPGVVSSLIEFNQSQLEGLISGDYGEMSSAALLARYYACVNEENTFLEQYTDI